MTTFFNLGNNESLSNYSWNDIVRPATEGRERAPLEKENFRPEDTEETEIFIRELVQNSLDAKDRDDSRFNNQPVFISSMSILMIILKVFIRNCFQKL